MSLSKRQTLNKSRLGVEQMKTAVLAFIAAVGLCLGLACQRSDQEAARERAERVKAKAEETAKRLGNEAKELGAKVDEKARQAKATQEAGGEASPEEKLRRGTAELKREGEQAGAKLSDVSQSAKVKYNLSSAMGLSAVSKISVESSGNTITLRGSVPTTDRKDEAERTALGTSGVIKVVNKLEVRP